MTGGSFTVMNRLPFHGIFTFNGGSFGISAGCHSGLFLLGGSDRTIRPEQFGPSASSTPVFDVNCVGGVERGPKSRIAGGDGFSTNIMLHQILTSKLNSKDVAMNGFGGAEDVSALPERLSESFLDFESSEAVGSLETVIRRGCLSLKLRYILFDLCKYERNRPCSNSKSEVLNSYGYEKEGSLCRFSSALE